MAEDAEVISPVQMDAAKMGGVGLPEQEQWMPPEDVLEGIHRPRGEIVYVGEQIIVEIYEDEPAVYRFPDPFAYDEYVDIQSGKLILTGADGVAHEYIAGDKLVVPKGWSGTWEMIGNYRELIVIDREAYEAEYGSLE
jgi:uncharacterized cupin superfamily protein